MRRKLILNSSKFLFLPEIFLPFNLVSVGIFYLIDFSAARVKLNFIYFSKFKTYSLFATTWLFSILLKYIISKFCDILGVTHDTLTYTF